MLRTRLWMGAVLVALVGAMLVADRPPWFPFLFLLLLVWGGYEAQGRLRAHALRDSLLVASPDQVPQIVAQMGPYRRWLDPLLKKDLAASSAVIEEVVLPDGEVWHGLRRLHGRPVELASQQTAGEEGLVADRLSR